jgi:hypothetical protein
MLNDTRVRNAKRADRPIKLSDSGGLHLLIQPNGSKLWRLAYRFGGKQKTLAIGVYPTVTLKHAREKRDEAKRLLADRIDPSTHRRLEKLAPWLMRWSRERHRLGRGLYDLGVAASVPRGEHDLDSLDPPLKLLVAHALDAAGMLNSHFPRDQKHEQFQEDGRLLLHHFVDCRATAPAKGGVHLPDGVGVEGMTRAVDVAAKISTRTWFNARLCRNEVSERIPRGRE